MAEVGEKNFFVYILASKRNGTLYTGVTANLPARIYTHHEDLVAGLTRRYGVHRLVWFEWAEFAEPPIRREKQIKKWRRAWKLELIEKTNPNWDDLYRALFS
jgi:putative endonuclease